MADLALLQLQVSVNQSWLDYLIVGLYFPFILGIGAMLRNRMRSSEDYSPSKRGLPSWVTGLAFLGANLDALEVLGVGTGAVQYRLVRSHFF